MLISSNFVYRWCRHTAWWPLLCKLIITFQVVIGNMGPTVVFSRNLCSLSGWKELDF